MPGLDSVVTERILYSGQVQGVGFRFATRSIAKHHPVTGYVRNQADGRVELVVRGTQRAVDAMLLEIAGKFKANIDHCDRQLQPSAGEFEQFEIRF